MFDGISALGRIAPTFLIFVIGVLAVLIILCLYRAKQGPRIADRILFANMISTMSISVIAILAWLLDESYLLDICILYALLGFLAVVVLSKAYIGEAEAKREAAGHDHILKKSRPSGDNFRQGSDATAKVAVASTSDTNEADAPNEEGGDHDNR